MTELVSQYYDAPEGRGRSRASSSRRPGCARWSSTRRARSRAGRDRISPARRSGKPLVGGRRRDRRPRVCACRGHRLAGSRRRERSARLFARRRRVARTALNDAAFALPAHRIVVALADAAARWRNADFPPRVRVTRALMTRLGYSEPVVDYALDRLFEDVTRESLEAVIESELGSLAALDGFVARAGRPDVFFRGVGRAAIVSSETTIGVALPPLLSHSAPKRASTSRIATTGSSRRSCKPSARSSPNSPRWRAWKPGAALTATPRRCT